LSSGAVLFAADTGVIFSDADNDGVIDQLDQCPDTLENSYVNKFGCTELQTARLNKSKTIEDNANRGPNKYRMTINRSTDPIDLYKLVLGSSIEKSWQNTNDFDELAKLDQDLDTRIQMEILKTGEVVNVSFEKASGNKYLDESAKQAVLRLSPLPPLPKGMESYKVIVMFSPRGLK